jgi:peptide/nickel transport system permease protein
MAPRNKPYLAFALLAVSHGLLLLAGFFAPYDPTSQDRELPFAPPARVHFVDRDHKLHLLPFVYRWSADTSGRRAYHEDQQIIYPLRFFSQQHFFTADPPAKIFLMGSDAYGRDQFSRLLVGGRISLFAGLVATAISLILGVILGGVAGFYGRWLDELIMRAAEIFLTLPWLYLLFAVRAFLPLHIAPNGVFLLLISVLGAIGWARPARLIRGLVLSAKERDYVLAARGFGASDAYLLRRHVLPEAASVILTQAAVLVPTYILAEVVLSFFGLGVSEPAPSWGNLLANLRQFGVLESYWWMFLPALALVPVFLAYYSVFSYYGYYRRYCLTGGGLEPESRRLVDQERKARETVH